MRCPYCGHDEYIYATIKHVRIEACTSSSKKFDISYSQDLTWEHLRDVYCGDCDRFLDVHYFMVQE